MRICTVENCLNKYRARDLCNKHYKIKFRKTRTPELTAWTNMKDRCNNRNYQGYKNYGGRNIRVCDEWLHDFNAFHNDVGDKPTKQHSLDRINGDGNYEPGNVKWSTAHEQSSNVSTNTEVVGVNFNKRFGVWQARLMINGANVLNKRFLSFSDAVEARKQAELLNNITITRRITT